MPRSPSLQETPPISPSRVSARLRGRAEREQHGMSPDAGESESRILISPNKETRKKRSVSTDASSPLAKRPTSLMKEVSKKAPRLASQAPTFEDQFRQLEDFFNKFGHSHVPQNTKYGPLARWCYSQKRRRTGDYGTPLTKAEIAKFEKLQFDWTFIPKGKRPTFEDKCQELEVFAAQHGHCVVPRTGKYNLLGDWLYCMHRRRRAVYKRCRPLTKGQIERLEKIGVKFQLEKTNKTAAKLIQFKSEEYTKDSSSEHVNATEDKDFVDDQGDESNSSEDDSSSGDEDDFSNKDDNSSPDDGSGEDEDSVERSLVESAYNAMMLMKAVKVE